MCNTIYMHFRKVGSQAEAAVLISFLPCVNKILARLEYPISILTWRKVLQVELKSIKRN